MAQQDFVADYRPGGPASLSRQFEDEWTERLSRRVEELMELNRRSARSPDDDWTSRLYMPPRYEPWRPVSSR